MPQAEGSRGWVFAVKSPVWTGAHPLQGGVQGRQMDRFRHKPCRLGGGLEALEGRRIRLGAHVDDGDRRRGLNVSCGVNAVHRPAQMDVHQHDMGVEGEGLLNGLRAATGLSHDLIPQAAEPRGQVYRRDRFILDNDNAGRRVHRATFGGRSPAGCSMSNVTRLVWL
jgi:hypothetical protein